MKSSCAFHKDEIYVTLGLFALDISLSKENQKANLRKFWLPQALYIPSR